MKELMIERRAGWLNELMNGWMKACFHIFVSTCRVGPNGKCRQDTKTWPSHVSETKTGESETKNHESETKNRASETKTHESETKAASETKTVNRKLKPVHLKLQTWNRKPKPVDQKPKPVLQKLKTLLRQPTFGKQTRMEAAR